MEAGRFRVRLSAVVGNDRRPRSPTWRRRGRAVGQVAGGCGRQATAANRGDTAGRGPEADTERREPTHRTGPGRPAGGTAEATRTQRAKRPTPPSQPASPSSLPGFRARAPCDPPRRINKSKRAARFASARLPVCFSFPPVVRSVREPPRPSARARSLATSTRRTEIREPSRLSLLLSRCGICIRDSFPDGGAFQRINASESEDSPTDGSGGNGSSRALRP